MTDEYKRQGHYFGLKIGVPIQEGRVWRTWVQRRDVNSRGGLGVRGQSPAENGFYVSLQIASDDSKMMLHQS